MEKSREWGESTGVFVILSRIGMSGGLWHDKMRKLAGGTRLFSMNIFISESIPSDLKRSRVFGLSTELSIR